MSAPYYYRGTEEWDDRDNEANRDDDTLAMKLDATPDDDTPDPPLDIRYGKRRLPMKLAS